MDVRECRDITMAVWLHFKSGSSYDYFKYDGRLRGRGEKRRSTQGTKGIWSYSLTAREFNETEYPFFLAVTYYNNPRTQVRDLLKKSNLERWEKWKDRQKNRVQLIHDELDSLDIKKAIQPKPHEMPELFNLIGEKIGTDTFIMLDTTICLVRQWDVELKDEFVYQQWVARYKKFRPFMYAYMPYDRLAYAAAIQSTHKEIKI